MPTFEQDEKHLEIPSLAKRPSALQSPTRAVSQIMGTDNASALLKPRPEASHNIEILGVTTAGTSRKLLVQSAKNAGLGDQLSFIEQQAGMFSLLPLDDEQVIAMRQDQGVYIVDGASINMCGVNEDNVDTLIQAFKAVASA